MAEGLIQLSVSGFEFRYLYKQPKGGVLAFTSTAMMEKLPASEHMMLYQHISRHAELIYHHASTLHRIPDEEEGLYIVTGCMKSDSWALAGYTDPMAPPEDVLNLIKPRAHHSSGTPAGADRRYLWENKGSADGFSGASERRGLQTHSLFLQGFKLGFTQSFRSRVKNPEYWYTGGSGSTPPDSNSPGPPPSSNDKDNHGTDSGAGKRGGGRFSSMFNRSSSNSGPSDTGFDLTSFPNAYNSVVCVWLVSPLFFSLVCAHGRSITLAIQSIGIC